VIVALKKVNLLFHLMTEIKSAFELIKNKALQGEGGLQDLKIALEQVQLNEEPSNRDHQGGSIFTITILFVD